ncbi:MAG: hypothetical protein ACR2GH_17685 [Pseudonocardia sp.]
MNRQSVTKAGAGPAEGPTASPECGSAALSTGTVDVTRTSGPTSVDPCAPPDDPRSKLPDGLLRIEVIDGGTEQTARFAWSYADGGDAVAAAVAETAHSGVSEGVRTPALGFGLIDSPPEEAPTRWRNTRGSDEGLRVPGPPAR